MTAMRWEKITRWVMFSVLFALTPLMGRGFDLFLHLGTCDFDRLLQRGELFLICTGLAANAVGELIPTQPDGATRKLVAAGGCMLVVCFAALCFTSADVASGLNAHAVAMASSFLFLGTLVSGGCCMYLAQEEEP